MGGLRRGGTISTIRQILKAARTGSCASALCRSHCRKTRDQRRGKLAEIFRVTHHYKWRKGLGAPKSQRDGLRRKGGEEEQLRLLSDEDTSFVRKIDVRSRQKARVKG